MQKILIVEDDKFLRDLLKAKLEKDSNFSVVSAIDGEEGIKKIEEEKPDIVLLDLILPNMDGFDVLENIKGNPNISKTKVIVLSNLGQEEDLEKAISLGAKDYLVKAHFTLDEIIVKIKKYL